VDERFVVDLEGGTEEMSDGLIDGSSFLSEGLADGINKGWPNSKDGHCRSQLRCLAPAQENGSRMIY
jgi:hypothetical protein